MIVENDHADSEEDEGRSEEVEEHLPSLSVAAAPPAVAVDADIHFSCEYLRVSDLLHLHREYVALNALAIRGLLVPAVTALVDYHTQGKIITALCFAVGIVRSNWCPKSESERKVAILYQ